MCPVPETVPLIQPAWGLWPSACSPVRSAVTAPPRPTRWVWMGALSGGSVGPPRRWPWAAYPARLSLGWLQACHLARVSCVGLFSLCLTWGPAELGAAHSMLLRQPVALLAQVSQMQSSLHAVAMADHAGAWASSCLQWQLCPCVLSASCPPHPKCPPPPTS